MAKKEHKKRLKEMSESARLERHAKRNQDSFDKTVEKTTLQDVIDQDEAAQRDVEIMAARAMAGESINHE